MLLSLLIVQAQTAALLIYTDVVEQNKVSQDQAYKEASHRVYSISWNDGEIEQFKEKRQKKNRTTTIRPHQLS